MCMSNNHQYLATGSKDGTARIWDIFSHMKDCAAIQISINVRKTCICSDERKLKTLRDTSLVQ